MFKILSIDTSGRSSSCSIFEDSKVLGEIYLDCGLVHSKTMHKAVLSLFDLTSLKVKDIDFFAVCNGPGSYTGIRIGVSFVRGLSLSTGKPCIGVSSLLALAYSVKNLGKNSVIYSCIKANKDEIYFNSYIYDENTNDLHANYNDYFINFDDLCNVIDSETKKIIMVGDASDICYEKFKDSGKIDRVELQTVNSSCVGVAAYHLFLRGEKSDAFSLRANYLKEVKIDKRKN